MIKRTELEILNMAILIARQEQSTRDELEQWKNKDLCCCDLREPKLKKGDTEGLRKYYEQKIRLEISNCSIKADKEKHIAKLEEKVFELHNQVELLRWLYKDMPIKEQKDEI